MNPPAGDPGRSPAAQPVRVGNRGANLSLPVVEIDPRTGRKRSRAGRWRACSLLIVHVLMVGHFLHWLWAGKTLTPIEPSESADMIRRGEINMGLVFFALALLATLVLGRWVCGWGCHLVAYQDLTLWVLKKFRKRPKAFRTRFMLYIPLVIAAGWMFIVPLASRIAYAVRGYETPRLSWHLSRTGFWDTFPELGFAILTVFVTGVLMIYLLGPKGFCTFACPYGAFFGLTDKLATGRIRVTDACRQCGHCTAACTSNVNVAEEVRLYRMVVNPGCMKCLDCVQVCPNDALYFGFGRPSIGAKPAGARKQVRYDMTLGEEIAALAVFLGSLVTVNGLYGHFPFLLSLGIAGVIAFLTIKAVRLFSARDVLIQKLRLKVGGRIRPLGAAFLAGMGVLFLLLAHSAGWRYHDYLGDRAFAASPAETGAWQYDPEFVRRATPEELKHIRAGIRHYEACERWGLFDDAENLLHLAWLYLFTDDRAKASAHIRRALAFHPDAPELWLTRAKVETFLGNPDAALRAFEKAVALESAERETLTRKAGPMPHPLSSQIWTEWGLFQARRGQVREAERTLLKAVEYDSASVRARVALAGFQMATDQSDAARETLLEAFRLSPHEAAVLQGLAGLRRMPQDQARAVRDYRAALTEHPNNGVLWHNLALALTNLKRYPQAVEAYRQSLEILPEAIDARAELGAVLLSLQDYRGAIAEYERITEKLPDNGEAAFRLGFLYLQAGRRSDAVRLLTVAATRGTPSQRRQAAELLRQIGATQPAP